VLEVEHAAFAERRRNAGRHRFHDRRRYENASRVREAFETRRNDKGLAERKIVLEQNVTEMDADPQANRVELRHGREAGLRLECAANGIDGALEESENTVSGHPEKPSAMGRKLLAGDAPGRPQGIEGIGLVDGNQTAEIGHIRCEDRS
jgi:hypothetical protein